MQRKLDKKKVYNAGKGKINQELVYLHMSNHYRRILNAKKTVDNSLPYSYKAKRPSTSKPTTTTTRNKLNRPLESPALTERSISTNSNKGSYWGTESYAGSSRYHARCIPEGPSFAASTKQNCIDMDLVDRITYDTKNGPATYCEEGWLEAKDQHNDKRYTAAEIKQNKSETNFSSSAKRSLPNPGSYESAQKRKFAVQKKLKSSEGTVKGNKSFPSLGDKFYPKPLKIQAVSKLRSLRVYYPPRRKESRSGTDNSSNARISCALETSNCKCTKICVCDTTETIIKKTSFNPKEQSLTSSRDSAYNGGVSSLPESRSPTPDERRKKECCCCCCEKKQRDVKIVESSKATANSIGSPIPFQQTCPLTPKTKTHGPQESLQKIQEDALYVKFIQDITTEVLEKNLYTNKALKKVMKKHIKNNLGRLSKDRMLKEVENLRIQLGIPEDKTLFNLDGDAEDNCSDVLKYYPIISDSEFVMPKNVTAERVNGIASGTKTSGEMPKSISAVLSSEDEKLILTSETEDDGEVISVIQVTKAVQERRKEKSIEKTSMAISQENSSDDSDLPFCSNKRSVLKNFKQKLFKTYSPSCSSSDSETSKKFSEGVREKPEGEVSAPENTRMGGFGQKSSSLSKKNRNVSFWKNPDHNRSRTIEVTEKKTVTRGKETVLHDVKKNKPKSD